MGDRGNIIVKDRGSQVFLYTHWGGYELPNVLKDALIRGEDRWNDGQYLARVIFCEMVKDDIEGTTGYGISSVIGDGGKDITVDVDTQTVNGVPFEKYIDST